MAQSLGTKFNGNRQEVVDYAGKFGISEAMNKYEVKSYLSMRRFLIEETRDENYGINPKFPKLCLSGNQNILDQFVQKFADYVVKTETQIKQKDGTIKLLKAELDFYRHNEIKKIEPQLISIMEACEV